jgi:hypothetical protein
LGAQRLDFKTVCRLPFGAYVQVHDDLMITNTMESRTTGAINLGPTGNIQGAHRFYSLATGDLMVRRKWTELSVSTEVIIRLEELSSDPMDSCQEIMAEEDSEDAETDNQEEHEEASSPSDAHEEVVSEVVEDTQENQPTEEENGEKKSD